MMPWFIGFIALNVATLAFGLWLEEAQKTSGSQSLHGTNEPENTNHQEGDQ